MKILSAGIIIVPLMFCCIQVYAADSYSLLPACINGCAGASYNESDKEKAMQACIKTCVNAITDLSKEKPYSEPHEDIIASPENNDSAVSDGKADFDSMPVKIPVDENEQTGADYVSLGQTGIGNRFVMGFDIAKFRYNMPDVLQRYVNDGHNLSSIAVYSGYNINEIIEAGIEIREFETMDFSGIVYYGGYFYDIDGTYSLYATAAYLKINIMNLFINRGESLLVYAKLIRNKLHEKVSIRQAGSVKGHSYNTGYEIGINLNFGRDRNYTAGLEMSYYEMHNRKLAQSYGINIGYRFGESSASNEKSSHTSSRKQI